MNSILISRLEQLNTSLNEDLVVQIVSCEDKEKIDRTVVSLMKTIDSLNVCYGGQKQYLNVYCPDQDEESRGWLINAFLKKKLSDPTFEKKVRNLYRDCIADKSFFDISSSDLIEAVITCESQKELEDSLCEKLTQISPDEYMAEHWPQVWNECVNNALGIRVNPITRKKSVHTYFFQSRERDD